MGKTGELARIIIHAIKTSYFPSRSFLGFQEQHINSGHPTRAKHMFFRPKSNTFHGNHVGYFYDFFGVGFFLGRLAGM